MSAMNINILSSSQLLESQTLSQTFPEYGRSKLNDVKSHDQKDEEAFQRYMDERKSCLSEVKCARLSNLIRGEFNIKKGMIKVCKLKGKGVQHLGYHCSEDGRLLYPEEALYLMDCKRLEVYYNSLPISMQEAYSITLKNKNQQSRYLVYSHLSSLGYGVIRFKQRLPVCDSNGCESKKALYMEEVEINNSKYETAFNSKIRVSPKVDSFNAGPCLLVRFPDIKFPNIYKRKTNTKQLFEDGSLYPPGVCSTSQNNCNLDSDVPPRKRSRFENSDRNESLEINNWSSYHNYILRKKCKENDLISTGARSIIDYRYSTSTDNVLQRLNSMVKVGFTEPQLVSPKFDIHYDVYLPADLKRGSLKNQLPHHHLTIVSQNDHLPLPCDIENLSNRINDLLPIQFGVVDNGDVAYYSFNHVRVQPFT